jgi:hypothetical protein
MKNKIMLLMMVLLLFSTAVSALDISVNDYDPRPAEAGKAVNIWFKVDNPSNEAEKDLVIEITPKDGLKLTSGEPNKKTIGIIPSRGSHIVQFRFLVDDVAFKGSHIIEARITKGTTASLKRDLSIEVTDKDFKDVDLAVGDIESDPLRIKPDDENVKLEVTIQNLGDGKAQGVKAELVNLPRGVTLSESYSGSSLLGNIEADSTSKATFYIDVDKTVIPKEHTAGIKTTYKYKPDEEEDDYEFKEIEIPLKIAIKAVPIYNITNAELSQSVLKAGDKDIRLRITIKNIGEEKGESVRIKVYGKTEQPISFEKSSDFIAPILEPGEEGQGTLEFKLDDDANLQKYFLDIEIKSIVGDDVLTYNEKIPITVSKHKPNNPWKIVSLGIILIAGFIGWKVYKKQKKSKKKVEPKRVEGSYGESFLKKIVKNK